MAKQDDVLSREVAISGKLVANGLTVETKSRAIAAIDRLVGSVVDWPAAYFEGRAAKQRLKDEHERRLMDAQALIAEQQMQGHHELGAILVNDMLKDQARKRANAACVALEAIEELKALPAPSMPNEANSVSIPDVDVDEDWMNQFTRYAEDASSDRLQQVWGRVLAGEIYDPGSFSRQTLRFIAELDRETAENCELLRQALIGEWALRSERWETNKLFLVSVSLERSGIIDGTGNTLKTLGFIIDPDGTCEIHGRHMGIILYGHPGVRVPVNVFTLTNLGQQVMSLRDLENEEENLREVAQQMDKSGLTSISLGAVTKIDGKAQFEGAMEVIWPVPATAG